jgi:predicted RNase H-like HicB family nuclease
MRSAYTAVIKQDGKCWIGWVEEIPGVNCQEDTREELTQSLQEALRDALAFNRHEARAAAGEDFSEIKLAV